MIYYINFNYFLIQQNRIQFDDTATRTFEYPSEASMLEDEGTSVDGETSASGVEQQQHQSQLSIIGNKSNCTNTTNPILSEYFCLH